MRTRYRLLAITVLAVALCGAEQQDAAASTPSISINDQAVDEYYSANSAVDFTVVLSAASTQTITVQYATADGTATAGSDYTARSGTLTFPPGSSKATISVTILGTDWVAESDETFFVNLSNATNATIADGQGVGTIHDFDPPAENVSWTDLVGVSVSGNSLTKTGGTGWAEGAVSSKFIAVPIGYMEFTATEVNTSRMAGLGRDNASASYTDIEYAIYLKADGTVWVFESGTAKDSFGAYAPWGPLSGRNRIWWCGRVPQERDGVL